MVLRSDSERLPSIEIQVLDEGQVAARGCADTVLDCVQNLYVQLLKLKQCHRMILKEPGISYNYLTLISP